MSRLSVVLPAYNEELMVGKTCRVLHEVLAEAGISYELVVVDDGSKDKTWEEITKAGEKDGNVLGVHFSRNFGKEAAVYAGMAHVDLALLNDHELDLDSTMMYRHEDYVDAIRLVSEGKIQLKPLMSRHFAFGDYQKAYQYIDANREATMKILIDVAPCEE